MSNTNTTLFCVNANSKYPIKYVSIVTGLKQYVLRSWESRYSAICPERTKSRRQLYTVSDINRLQLINEAICSGHSISQVAPLSDDELVRLLGRAKHLNDFSPERDKNLSADDKIIRHKNTESQRKHPPLGFFINIKLSHNVTQAYYQSNQKFF